MVRVDTKGRIVIPSEVRKQLGLRPGSEVDVTAMSGRAIVEPETDPEQLMCNLEAMIDEATTNREHRRENDTEGYDRTLDTDTIAAHHREIVRRGADQTETTESDDE